MRHLPRLSVLVVVALALVGCAQGLQLPDGLGGSPTKPAAQNKPAPATAPAIDPIDADWTLVRDANLRAGPGTDYAVVGTLRSGATVRVEGRVQKRRWLRVSSGGRSAFLHESLAKPVAVTPAPAPVVGGEDELPPDLPQPEPPQPVGGEDELPEPATPSVGGEDEIAIPRGGGPAG